MTDLQMLGNSFCKFGAKNIVPLFDPTVKLFENSLLTILVQLLCKESTLESRNE